MHVCVYMRVCLYVCVHAPCSVTLSVHTYGYIILTFRYVHTHTPMTWQPYAFPHRDDKEEAKVPTIQYAMTQASAIPQPKPTMSCVDSHTPSTVEAREDTPMPAGDKLPVAVSMLPIIGAASTTEPILGPTAVRVETI